SWARSAAAATVLSGRQGLRPQPPPPPHNLTAVARRVVEEGGLDVVGINHGVGFEGDAKSLELGSLRGHIVDPERQMTYPALVGAGGPRRPADDLDGHASLVD